MNNYGDNEKDLDNAVLLLINNTYDYKRIIKSLHISSKQLLSSLKRIRDKKLAKYVNRVDMDGNVFCDIENYLSSKGDNIIELPNNKSNFNIVVAADTHLGSVFDTPKDIDACYNYASKIGSHIVILNGDIINGFKFNKKDVARNNSVEEEYEYFLKNYPHADNITTILVPGNHDHYPYYMYDFDFLGKLKEDRVDIIPMDTSVLYIEKGKNKITFAHKYETLIKEVNRVKLGFCGHSHEYNVSSNNLTKRTIVTMPTLSDMAGGHRNKGFMELNIETNYNGIDDVCVSEKVFTKGIRTAAQFTYHYKK